ncbi:hypothetical protein [Vibrio mangrovi]|uniref:Uncharacterized protein n=1 Tax=Vibrio mangrovi TaxID=474394 RepID=A0ABU4I4N5_9VIBR|nr:hypothetical protein [Vibrio mangrovi]MDW6002900.1 hypothetical protein [Vibrio mangrovi]
MPERFLTDYSTRCNAVSGENNTDNKTVLTLFDKYQISSGKMPVLTSQEVTVKECGKSGDKESPVLIIQKQQSPDFRRGFIV